MRELSKEEVLNFWKETERKTNVYIHSPFCKEQCTYCTFKGALFEKSAFHRYYSEYLPNQIKFFEPVLSSDIIYSYFWGGGTPTLMTPKIMQNIFDLIPNFKECKRKLMEFHMCDWTRGQLDMLKEYNFNTVIACVQTFDRDIVKQQKRRAPKNDDVIFEFIDYANSLGLFVMSDIIFFDTGDINRDLDRLSLDIQKLADNDITEISVQTIFDEEGKYDVQVTKRVKEFLDINTQYIQKPLSYYNPTNSFCDSRGNKTRKELKVYKSGVDWEEMSFQDNCLDGMNSTTSSQDYNVLGIGSYKNHKHTTSKIEDKLEYIEDSDTYTPKWMLTYDKKEWSTKKMINDFYTKLENTIGEPPDGIAFLFDTKVINYNEDSRDKIVQRELGVTVRWEEASIIITDYVKKLKKLYPHWGWKMYDINDEQK